MKKSFVKTGNVSRETFLRRMSVALAVLSLVVFAIALRHSVYNVYIEGEFLAAVENASIFDEAHREAINNIAQRLDGTVPEIDVQIRRCFSITKKQTVDAGVLTQLLLNELERVEITGYNVYVDGKYTATGIGERKIRDAIDKTEKMYIKLNDFLGGDKCEGIAENIRITECKTAIGNICTEEKLLEIFGYNSLERQYEKAINEQYFSEEVFSPGLSLSGRERQENDNCENLIEPTVFSFEKSHEEILVEDIPYEVEKVFTSQLAQGNVELCKRGEPGKKNVSYTVYTCDGIETGRRKNSEQRISEPENCVMYVGTYEKTKGDGYPEFYGKFMLPCSGIKTSGYGMRELFGQNNLHKGCDIAAPDGTEIVCASKGTVSYAGENGNGYGIHVVVDHGNGYETLYAHMRKSAVKTGDEVLMGQKLGEVGLTGNTTGFHLHFEILKDGVAVNPESFIRVS